MRRLRNLAGRGHSKLSYANVMSTIAVFIALGGTSYAVARNSIGTRELRNSAVNSAKVRDGSLQRKDLAAGLGRGPRGLQGPSGPIGPSSVRIAPAKSSVNLAGVPAAETQVRRMDDVPAGSWNVRFVGSPQLVAENGLHVTCAIKINGDVRASGATVVGNATNASQESNLVLETAVVAPTPFNITVDCSQNIPSAPPVSMNRPQIVAAQVGDVVVTP